LHIKAHLHYTVKKSFFMAVDRDRNRSVRIVVGGSGGRLSARLEKLYTPSGLRKLALLTCAARNIAVILWKVNFDTGRRSYIIVGEMDKYVSLIK
jgi:hypothetical protein